MAEWHVIQQCYKQIAGYQYPSGVEFATWPFNGPVIA